MAKNKPEPPKQEEAKAEVPLVLTLSQIAKLTDEEKAKFRHSGGTAIEDPIP
jgi:hypothetical protein